MKLYKAVLKAGEESYFSVTGSTLTAITLPDRVRVTFNGDEGFTTDLIAGLSIKPARKFDSLVLFSDVDQTIEFMAGFGAVNDARLVLSGVDLETITKGSSSFVNAAVSVGTGATLLSAADVYKTAVTIQPMNTVYIGGSGVTVSNGVQVLAGQTMEIRTQAAVYAVAGSGSIDVRVLSEVK